MLYTYLLVEDLIKERLEDYFRKFANISSIYRRLTLANFLHDWDVRVGSQIGSDWPQMGQIFGALINVTQTGTNSDIRGPYHTTSHGTGMYGKYQSQQRDQ